MAAPENFRSTGAAEQNNGGGQTADRDPVPIEVAYLAQGAWREGGAEKTLVAGCRGQTAVSTRCASHGGY